jgi:hypothetical protein
MLQKDRIKYNKNKPVTSHSRNIMLISVNDTSFPPSFNEEGQTSSPRPPLQGWAGEILISPLPPHAGGGGQTSDVKIFSGVRPCIRYLKDEKGLPATRETLLKYIMSGKEYHGYFCKFV